MGTVLKMGISRNNNKDIEEIDSIKILAIKSTQLNELIKKNTKL